jgi:hypothetical protein
MTPATTVTTATPVFGQTPAKRRDLLFGVAIRAH